MAEHHWVSRLAAGALFLTAATVLAGEQPAQRPGAAAPAERYVAIGCIRRETTSAPAGQGRGAPTQRFIILDTRSDPPTRYELQGDAKELDLHVGHTMEVKGPLSPPARGSSANLLVMKVESLTWISSSCAK